MRLADGGSGPLNSQAAEAAAEAAAKAAAEAAAKAAAEAAARAAAAAAAKAAAAKAAQAAKAHTGRLSLATQADHGDLPWGSGAKAAIGVVAGSAAYKTVKDSLSAHKKVEHLMGLSDKLSKARDRAARDLQAAGNDAKKLAAEAAVGGDAAAGVAEAGQEASHAKALGALGRFTSGVRVISGLNSAADLPGAIGALAHGPNVQNVTRVAGDALNTVRGADEAVKFLKNSPVGFLSSKMNPVLSIAGDATDAVSRVDNLAHNWGKMSTTDKISNVANVASDVADGVGSALEMAPPPADVAGIALKGVGAGLALVGLGAQYAPKVAHFAGEAAQEVGHVASEAGQDVAHAASDVGHAAVSAAKDVGHAISHIFSGW